jgi:hypothetical protein
VNRLLEKQRIEAMSPTEAEMMAYRLSSSHYDYGLKLESYKDNIELWHLQQIEDYLS